MVWIELSVCRWRCLNSDCCRRRTFSDHDTAVAAPHARRTSRQAQLLGHMAHAAGGSPAERLLRRLGIRVSDDPSLRQLLRAAQVAPPRARIIRPFLWAFCLRDSQQHPHGQKTSYEVVPTRCPSHRGYQSSRPRRQTNRLPARSLTTKFCPLPTMLAHVTNAKSRIFEGTP